METRPAAVAGTWYPGTPGALAREIDEYLAAAGIEPSDGITALVAPHAGLMFSGRIGAYAYKMASAGAYDVAFLVGPSHFVAFDGVSVWPEGSFTSPLGDTRIDAGAAAEILRSPIAHELPAAHRREHSLEMQLPFLRRLFPDLPIVPILMGYQQRETIESLAQALAQAVGARRALLIASTDLSHYFDAKRAAALDGEVQRYVERFDVEGLFAAFERYPEGERGRYVACGGGPALSVMLAARRLGAREGKVLQYGHSGEISGDNDGVVGYMAAAFGRFDSGSRGAPHVE